LGNFLAANRNDQRISFTHGIQGEENYKKTTKVRVVLSNDGNSIVTIYPLEENEE
jgi:hypothetical protein